MTGKTSGINRRAAEALEAAEVVSFAAWVHEPAAKRKRRRPATKAMK